MNLRERASQPEHKPQSTLSIPYLEFVALGAMLIALTALSIDIMLPALPRVAAEYGLSSSNDQQLVVFGYLIGSGPGQLFFGAISDRYGRRPVLLVGLAIFILASLLAVFAPTFNLLIIARILQGIGASAPRTILIASVRDLFVGARMAQVMSTIMTVFLVVPLIAPAIGQGLILVGHWNTPFYFLFGFGCIAFVWASLRFPETRSPAADPQRKTGVLVALSGMASEKQTVTYIIASGFMLGCLLSYVASSQQIFVDIYQIGPLFPVAFAGTAAAMILANFTNARIVMRFGPRIVSHTALALFALVSVLFLALALSQDHVGLYTTWAFFAVSLFLFGLILQNFNALAMEPQGTNSGLAASILGTYTTLAGAALGSLVGRNFDGSVIPIAAGFTLLSLLAIVTVGLGDNAFRKRYSSDPRT